MLPIYESKIKNRPPPLITELKALFEDHHAKALCVQRPLHNAADADDADYIDAYQDCIYAYQDCIDAYQNYIDAYQYCIDAYQEDHFRKCSELLCVSGLRSRCLITLAFHISRHQILDSPRRCYHDERVSVRLMKCRHCSVSSNSDTFPPLFSHLGLLCQQLNQQDHRMNVAPDQTIILDLEIFLDHRSLSSTDQKIMMTPLLYQLIS